MAISSTALVPARHLASTSSTNVTAVSATEISTSENKEYPILPINFLDHRTESKEIHRTILPIKALDNLTEVKETTTTTTTTCGKTEALAFMRIAFPVELKPPTEPYVPVAYIIKNRAELDAFLQNKSRFASKSLSYTTYESFTYNDYERLQSGGTRPVTRQVDLKTHSLFFMHFAYSNRGGGEYISKVEQTDKNLNITVVTKPEDLGVIQQHQEGYSLITLSIPKTTIPIESCSITNTSHERDPLWVDWDRVYRENSTLTSEVLRRMTPVYEDLNKDEKRLWESFLHDANTTADTIKVEWRYTADACGIVKDKQFTDEEEALIKRLIASNKEFFEASVKIMGLT